MQHITPMNKRPYCYFFAASTILDAVTWIFVKAKVAPVVTSLALQSQEYGSST